MKAHALIEGLREISIKQGIVDKGFQERVRNAHKALFARFVEEVDQILGLREKAHGHLFETRGVN